MNSIVHRQAHRKDYQRFQREHQLPFMATTAEYQNQRDKRKHQQRYMSSGKNITKELCLSETKQRHRDEYQQN